MTLNELAKSQFKFQWRNNVPPWNAALHIATNYRSTLSITSELRMPEVLHAHPGDHNPYPGHDARENHEGRIVPNNRQSVVVLKLRRRVRRCANVPGPAPDPQARPHAHDEDNPGNHE